MLDIRIPVPKVKEYPFEASTPCSCDNKEKIPTNICSEYASDFFMTEICLVLIYRSNSPRQDKES